MNKGEIWFYICIVLVEISISIRETFTNIYTRKAMHEHYTRKRMHNYTLIPGWLYPLRLSNFYSVSLAAVFQSEFSPN